MTPQELAQRMADLNQREVTITEVVTPHNDQTIDGVTPDGTHWDPERKEYMPNQPPHVTISDATVDIDVVLDEEGQIIEYVPWEFGAGPPVADARPLIDFLFWLLNGATAVDELRARNAPEPSRKGKS